MYSFLSSSLGAQCTSRVHDLESIALSLTIASVLWAWNNLNGEKLKQIQHLGSKVKDA